MHILDVDNPKLQISVLLDQVILSYLEQMGKIDFTKSPLNSYHENMV